MKKYNLQNYNRYKKDLNSAINRDGMGVFYDEYTRNELIIKFMPLVENLGRKFSTSKQASGILSINDIIQIGNEALTRAVDKLSWEKLGESDDIEKTLKSFFSKRIKGAIRRRIDMMRGDMRIPEHRITEIRKNPDDEEASRVFFNAMFASLDEKVNTDSETGVSDSWSDTIPDNASEYNIIVMNAYLLGIMKEYLSHQEYEVLRLSYGLDCDKLKAKEIAASLNINGTSSYVRVSEMKKQAINKLITSVKPHQFVDFL